MEFRIYLPVLALMSSSIGIAIAAPDSPPLPRERPAAAVAMPLPVEKPVAEKAAAETAMPPLPRDRPRLAAADTGAMPAFPPVPPERPAVASTAATAPTPEPRGKPETLSPLPAGRQAVAKPPDVPLPADRPASISQPATATPVPHDRPATSAVPLPEQKPAPEPAGKATSGQPRSEDAEAADAPPPPETPAPPKPPRFADDAMSPACDAIEEGRVSGRPLKPIEDPVGCVVEEAYAISSVGTERAVELRAEATLNCPLAARLDTFVEEIVEPAARDILKSELTALTIAGSYVCRTRNNAPGGSPSEHGKANAIDVSGFVLADGRTVTVSEGWADAAETGAFLREIHDKACGPFTTVIGPDGDEYHRDHFHFDLQARGAGGQTTFCQ